MCENTPIVTCEEMWRGVRVRGQVRTMNSVKDMSSKMSFDRKIKTMQARELNDDDSPQSCSVLSR